MKQIAERYYDVIKQKIDEFIVTDQFSKELEFFDGIEKAAKLILECGRKNKKIMFIGNGASQAISSHISTDFWKNGGIQAIAFTDASLLTCIGNDYGYDYVFEKPIDMFANPEDVLVAISSSGKSTNIINGVQSAKEKRCSVITLSGFKNDNPLRQTGNVYFYVPYESYGPVEVLHHSICHCLLDTISDYKKNNGQGV